IANDRFLAIFEPASRFFVVDIASGKTVFEKAIPQSASMVNLPLGATLAVKTAIDDGTLVVVSAAQEVLSVDLNAGKVRWTSQPLTQKIASLRLLAGRV